MALEDKDIFNAIFNKYSDQPIEFIMEQYEKAKILNMAIERRINAQAEQPVKVEEAAPAALPPVDAPRPGEEEKKPAPAPACQVIKNQSQRDHVAGGPGGWGGGS